MYSKYVPCYVKNKQKLSYWHLHEICKQVFNIASVICYIWGHDEIWF